MEILVIGSELNLKECQEKFGTECNYQFAKNHSQAKEYFRSGLVIFDFEPDDVSFYPKDMIVFLNSVKTTLTQLAIGKEIQASIFGFSGMPSFLNREVLETTIPNKESNATLEKTCSQLNTKYKIVEDRAGMVTPRIICMIINEAYFAIEENVASHSDIDRAMKLGTNYPYGPFEWCDKIGIKNVYELLNAVQMDTKDDRYRICELLKNEALV